VRGGNLCFRMIGRGNIVCISLFFSSNFSFSSIVFASDNDGYIMNDVVLRLVRRIGFLLFLATKILVVVFQYFFVSGSN